MKPEQVEVDICLIQPPEKVERPESELDEMWSYVGKKDNPRWLWHAIDHQSGKVLAYVFGARKDKVFLELKACYSPSELLIFIPRVGERTHVI